MIVSNNLSFSVKSCVKEDRETSIIIQNNLFVNGSIHINDVDTNVIRNIINQKIPPASLVNNILILYTFAFFIRVSNLFLSHSFIPNSVASFLACSVKN